MAIVRERYSMSKESALRYIRDSAKFIYNNAEGLLGEYSRMTGINIRIHISVDEAPSVKVERSYVTAGYQEGFYDGENSYEVGQA